MNGVGSIPTSARCSMIGPRLVHRNSNGVDAVFNDWSSIEMWRSRRRIGKAHKKTIGHHSSKCCSDNMMKLFIILPVDLQNEVLSWIDPDALQELAALWADDHLYALLRQQIIWRIRWSCLVPRSAIAMAVLDLAKGVIHRRQPINDQRTFHQFLQIFMRHAMYDFAAICFGRPYFAGKIVRLASVIGYNSVELLELWLSAPGAEPQQNRNEALMAVCGRGDATMVKRLLRDARVDPLARGQQAMVAAVASGKVSVVRALLDDGRVSPSASSNAALLEAVKGGSVHVCRALLDDNRVDPNDTGRLNPILLAVHYHQRKILDLLLQDGRSDPTYGDNEPIRQAMAKGQHQIAKSLIANHRVTDLILEHGFPSSVRNRSRSLRHKKRELSRFVHYVQSK